MKYESVKDRNAGTLKIAIFRRHFQADQNKSYQEGPLTNVSIVKIFATFEEQNQIYT